MCSSDLKPQMLSGEVVKKGPPIYLSFVHGKVHRDLDWKSCESRVRGVDGAKYKKVTSQEEEQEVLERWKAGS